MKLPFLARTFPGAALLCASFVTTSVHAEIVVGDFSTGTRPELFFMMWDPVAKASYTLDLGINVYANNIAGGDASKNLFVYGQQDSGYQKLFDPLNTDPLFQLFLAKSTNVANQLWAVVAAGFDPTDDFAVGNQALFTTLRHNSPSGTVDPDYTALMGISNTSLRDITSFMGTQFNALNTFQSLKKNNTHLTLTNGSSFAIEGEGAYLAGGDSGLNLASGTGLLYNLQDSPYVFNKVGNSSWFYYVSRSKDNDDIPANVDEFDNRGADAYWGLGVDSNGKYILSYTLAPYLTPTSTLQGVLLRKGTDFSAAYGKTRLISVPGDALDLSFSAVTAVPEPSTWGLMGLGLALVAARARRRV